MSEQQDAVEQTYARTGPDEAGILAEFGVDASSLLGAGGEARVFALDEHRVLRIHASGEAQPDRQLAALLDSWAGIDLGFGLPRVLDQGRRGSQQYSIERRLPGTTLARWLAGTPDPARRRRGLLNLLEASGRLRELPLPRGPGPGRVLADERRFGSLTRLLAAQIEIGIQGSDGLLAEAVPHLDRHVSRFLERVDARAAPARFCHADLGPENVLVDADGSVTAVLDVSVHALAADPVLDQVGAVVFLELTPYPGNVADAAWLQGALIARLGADGWLVDAYRRFYALYYAMDHRLIPWCAAQLHAPEPLR